MYPLGMPPHYKAPDALQGLFGRYLALVNVFWTQNLKN